MLRPRSVLATAAVLAVLLGGCSSDPATDLRDAVAEAIEAANAGDAGDLRGALANLRAEIDQQVRANELDADEATRLLAILQQLEADAALLEQEEEPSPSPTPSRSPSRSPRPSPTQEPEQTEQPQESEEPEPEPSELLPSPVVTSDAPSASPAQAGRPVPASPSPSGA